LLQQKNLLPDNFPIDGFFWTETEMAIRDLQKSLNLEATGIVDQQIWQFLEGEIIEENLISEVKEDNINSEYLDLENINSEDVNLEEDLSDNSLIDYSITEIKEENLTVVNPPVNISYSNLQIGDGLNTPELQEEVKYLQKLLQNKGFFPQDIVVDGLFWQETEIAVKAFQKSKNLPENGIVESSTWMALENKTNLSSKPPINLEINLDEQKINLTENLSIETENYQNQFIFQQDLSNLEDLNPNVNENLTQNIEVIDNDNLTPDQTIEDHQDNQINQDNQKQYSTLRLGSGIDTPELQEEVKYLQQLLQEWGLLSLNEEINGLFWRETQDAVKLFQEKNNLPVNGIVDQNTWIKLQGFEINPDNLISNQDKEILNSSVISFPENQTEINNISDLNENIDNPSSDEENPVKEINNISEKKHPDLKLGDGIYAVALKEEVKYLQSLLKKHNFLPEDGVMDGLFWHKTQDAVKLFQQSQNLSADGMVTQEVWNALENINTSFIPVKVTPVTINSHPNLKLGDGINTPKLQGEVKQLQNLLKNHQLLSKNALVDGLFWRKTETAVKEFQKSQNLVPDGIVDEKTWNALESLNNEINLSTSSQETGISNPVKPVNKDPYPLLKIGDGMNDNKLHSDIKRLQTLLKKHHFLPENVSTDGVFWRETESAVKTFQKSKNLVADGVVGKKTWLFLEKEPVIPDVSSYMTKYPPLKLRDGIDTPNLQNAVKELQSLLKQWNFLHQNTVIDGLFWKTTEEGVKAFQKSQNLLANGIVEKETWECLQNYSPNISPENKPISAIPVSDSDKSISETSIVEDKSISDKSISETSIVEDKSISDKSVLDSDKSIAENKPVLETSILDVTEINNNSLETNKEIIDENTEVNTAPNKYPVLRLGDGIKTPELKDVVKKLQIMLKTYHFLPQDTVIDGLFTTQTETAVKNFQQNQDLTSDGIIGDKTWEFLEYLIDDKAIVKPVLKKQDGIDFIDLKQEVEILQNLLQQQNLMEIIDGKFEENTEKAVKTFQSQNNLPADGIVDQKTWAILTNQNVNTYFPLRQKSNLEMAKVLIQSISNPTIKKYANQSIPIILQEAQKYGITDKGQIAYILATAQHESRFGQWMVEFASGQNYEGRRDLGNLNLGDGARYKGRGFVQIIGRRNYTEWGQRLGIDLVNHPDKVTDYTVAAKILVLAMGDGIFTSRRLSQYVNESIRDFYNARRVINGLDQASHIAGLAENILQILNPL
jgi:peptidoglycan hydrolase-like protein with peptidoglycan-binding domain